MVETILQCAQDCVDYSESALNGYLGHKNLMVSMQFMTQAFFCAKQVQSVLSQPNLPQGAHLAGEFWVQFAEFNREFLECVESGHSLQHAMLNLETLKKTLEDAKAVFPA